MHPAAGSGRAVALGLCPRLARQSSIRESKPESIVCFGVLLRNEGSVIRACAAWQNKMIASDAECFVPRSCKAREKFFNCASADLDAWVNHFPPGSDVGPFLRFLKSDPLGEGNADGVVDPADFLSRDACGNYVVDDGIYGTQDFNLEAATGLPRVAVTPAHFAIDVGEIVPAMQIGKNEPSEGRARFGGN